MNLRISDPVLISMGPDSRKAGWGPYQFPDLIVLEDGRLFCAFNDRPDSEVDYGTERRAFVSSDRGQTWIAVKESDYDLDNGLTITNGDKLRFDEQKTIPLGDIDLSTVATTGKVGHIERKAQDFYLVDSISRDICPDSWILHRVKKGETEATIEPVKMNWPYQLVRAVRGVLVPPQPQCRLRMGPDGRLWMPHYGVSMDPVTGQFHPYQANILFCSEDEGHTWNISHYLPFVPKNDIEEKYEGFGENDIGFAPDGSLLRVIRTSGLYPRINEPSRHGPSYIVHSDDGGKTWTDHEVFDDRGVWPTLLTLKCGVTLCGYGRPGFFIRASFDPSCRKWEDRIEIVPSTGGPEPYVGHVVTKATCSYCDLKAIDDRTAGLVYSDFTIPDENGTPRKCMMFRSITVED